MLDAIETKNLQLNASQGNFQHNNSNPVIDDSKRLKVREHPIHGPFVEGLITRTVGSYTEVNNCHI